MKVIKVEHTLNGMTVVEAKMILMIKAFWHFSLFPL